MNQRVSTNMFANTRSGRKNLFDYLLYLYLSSIGILTLFNSAGHTPIPLLVSIGILIALVGFLLLTLRLRYRFTIEDAILFGYLGISLTSVVISSHLNTLNLNHLYAEFAIVLLYYFVLKAAIYNSRYLFQNGRLLFAVLIGALLVTLLGFVDYYLLIRGVNLADILPMEQANRVIRAGIFSRARSFLVEPTDYALCLNSLFPILVFYLLEKRKRIQAFLLGILYMSALATTFSVSGFASLIVGLSIAYFVGLHRTVLGKIRGLYYLKVTAVAALATLLVYLTWTVVYGDYVSTIVAKVMFSSESQSAAGRLLAYQRGVDAAWRTSWTILIGNGTGYISGLGAGSTNNWWLAVLAEKGILGIGALVLLLVVTFRRVVRMRGAVKYGLIISLVATVVHYNTQTGFYFPFFWLLLVLTQYLYFSERASATPKPARVEAQRGVIWPPIPLDSDLGLA